MVGQELQVPGAALKILLFGATGTAGGSVLRLCLSTPEVAAVRAVLRRPPAVSHDKLRVLIHKNYLDYTAIESAFVDVDACFFCLGISVSQVSGEEGYRTITRDFAVAAARMLRAQSPRAVFHYISGQGAALDSRFMWARVKAETEVELIDVFDAVCWRPGFIDGAASANAPRVYQWVRPAFRVLKPFRSVYVSGEDIGRAMLQATKDGVRGRVLDNAELRDIADRWRAAVPK